MLPIIASVGGGAVALTCLVVATWKIAEWVNWAKDNYEAEEKESS